MLEILKVDPLVMPSLGLIFWMTLTFGIVFLVLSKFAWKPMLGALKERETNINIALTEAEKVKVEMANIKNENESLALAAKEERAIMLKEAKETKDRIINEAKEQAKAEAAKIIADAQAQINQQKNAAMIDLKNQMGNMIIEVSEKVLRKELSDKAAQQNYIQQLSNEIKLN